MRICHIPAGSPQGMDHFLILTDNGRIANVVRTAADGTIDTVQFANGQERATWRRTFEVLAKTSGGYWMEVPS